MKYNFEIKTGDECYAGTDSNIFVTLEGEYGITEEQRLNGHIDGNAFERNEIDRCTLDFSKDVGRVFRIYVRSDCKYGGADWLLSYIDVAREKQSEDSQDDFCNKHSKFLIDSWIKDDKKREYMLSYSDWGENRISYQTKTEPYKEYIIDVPPKTETLFREEIKYKKGIEYSHVTTKKSTYSFSQEIGGNMEYKQSKKLSDSLKAAPKYSGYLKFAFSQGFENSQVDSVVKNESKEETVTVEQKIHNDSNEQARYKVKYSKLVVEAVACTGGVVAMFNSDSEIVFAGIEKME